MNQDVRISVLETPRLLLRPLRSDDAERLTELLQDPEIAKWTNSIPWPYSIEKNRLVIETLLDYAVEQRLTERRLKIEEMFAAGS